MVNCIIHKNQLERRNLLCFLKSGEMSHLGLPRLPACIRLPAGLLRGAGEIRGNQCDFKAAAPSQQPVDMPVNEPAGPLA